MLPSSACRGVFLFQADLWGGRKESRLSLWGGVDLTSGEAPGHSLPLGWGPQLSQGEAGMTELPAANQGFPLVFTHCCSAEPLLCPLQPRSFQLLPTQLHSWTDPPGKIQTPPPLSHPQHYRVSGTSSVLTSTIPTCPTSHIQTLFIRTCLGILTQCAETSVSSPWVSRIIPHCNPLG